jgi:hypothetical protein
MGLKRFEQRLERLVEGTFSKAFRSGLQPVEIGRKITRALDDGRTLGVDGVAVVPNRIDVFVSTTDFDRFETFADALTRELVDAARLHARDEGYQFVGPVSVELVEDTEIGPGRLQIEAVIAGGLGEARSLVLIDGSRYPLGEQALVIGRLAECDITLDDPRASRRHAEVRPDYGGHKVVDLGSMNGTTVNGVPVREHTLVEGDAIGVGSTVIRYET